MSRSTLLRINMPHTSWNFLWNRLWRQAPAPRRKDRRRPELSALGSIIEHFEARILPAALSDLTPVLIQAPDVGLTGTQIKISTEIDNLSKGASPRFQVEFRLSLDDVIDGQDRLLLTATRSKIRGTADSRFTQVVKLPGNLPAGTYHLGVVVDPANKVSESNDANNILVSNNTITITRLRDQLTGQVTYKKSTQPVEIHGLETGKTTIDPAITTWIVIHGRNQSSTSPNMVQLAQQIDQYQSGDQVLLLDWTKAAASGAIGGQGENFIQPVAAWAAKALTDYGFSGGQLNLVGYSWGAEIAAEMGEDIGRVNSILAIDPARDYPGGSYNPEKSNEVNLQSHAAQSWAFYATSFFPFGTPTVADTAEEDFVLTGSDHFGIVSAVTSLLALPAGNALAGSLDLSQLLTGVPAVAWRGDSYSDTGKFVKSGGKFDAVLVATSDGLSVASLRYFDGAHEQTLPA